MDNYIYSPVELGDMSPYNCYADISDNSTLAPRVFRCCDFETSVMGLCHDTPTAIDCAADPADYGEEDDCLVRGLSMVRSQIDLAHPLLRH